MISLNDLWAQIYKYYRATTAIVSKLVTPSNYAVEQYLKEARYRAGYIKRSTWDEVRSAISQIKSIIVTITSAISKTYEWSSGITSAARSVLRNIISGYIQPSLIAIETAVNRVNNQLDSEIGKIESRVNSIIDDMKIWVNDEMDAILLVMQSEIDNVTMTLNTEIDTLYDIIGDEIYDVHNYIDEELSDMRTNVQGSIDEVYSYIETRTATLKAEADSLFTGITAWIEEKTTNIFAEIVKVSDAVYSFIRRQVSSVTTWVTGLIDKVYLAIAQVYNDAVAEIRFWRGVLSKQIDTQIKSVVDQVNSIIESLRGYIATLVQLADWRFQYFSIFLSLPELSFLKVLTRSESDFVKYKPYWQALFARIMSE